MDKKKFAELRQMVNEMVSCAEDVDKYIDHHDEVTTDIKEARKLVNSVLTEVSGVLTHLREVENAS